MAPRSLLLIAVTIASAAAGASFAVTKQFQPQETAQQIVQPLTPEVIAATPQPTASPLFAPPSAISSTNGGEPIASSQTADELAQVKTQIRRAIRERNTVLLRSLLRTGSVREMLRTVAAPEQTNLDNLDASTWRILEKAVAHRCRQAQSIPGEATPEICFE